MAGQAVGFVGYGIDGGVRAVEHLRGITAELGMAGVGPAVALRLFDDFTDETVGTSERQQEALTRMLTGLARWGTALRRLRLAPLGDADAVIASFLDTLQAGLTHGDADLYDSRFGDDILWGSPYGEVLAGYGPLNVIHRSMMPRRTRRGRAMRSYKRRNRPRASSGARATCVRESPVRRDGSVRAGA